MNTKLAAALLLLATLLYQPSTAQSQGNAFTYQGRFTDNGAPYTGNAEIQATLWDAVSGGSQSATNAPAQVVVGVTNGLFVLPLNFGANFPGANRWLQLEVRTTIGAFTPLTPRQPLTATPYAITAANLSGTLAAASITGTIPLGQLPTVLVTNGASGVNLSGNLSGTFSGNGTGVTGVDLLTVNSQGAISFATNYGTFVLASSPGVGSGPNSVTAADVNGDGKADLVSANFNTNTLTVLTNNGNGGFVLASSPGVGSKPASVTAADVNGDNKMDLICANRNDNTLTVLTNNGSGGFVLASSPGVGNGPISVTAADVNGDGRADLIAANYAAASGNTLTVLTNNGSGSFVLASSPGVGNGPASITAADVNGDNKADLISANYSASTLTVLTNNGSGSFVLASSPGVGNGPVSVRAVDVNGDGKADLISANYAEGNGNTLTVLTNNGSGGFALASSPGVGNGPVSVRAADVNADGKADLISANYAASSLTVLTNNGSSGFVLASSPGVGSGPSEVTAADVNGDGKEDLISANYAGTGNTLTVLLNTATYTGAFSGTVSGNGSGLISLNANNLATGNVPAAALNNAWKITGNTGTTPGTHFLGTTDNQPLEFKVNGQRVLRIGYATDGAYGDSPSSVGGFFGNVISNGLVGAVIGGGGYSAGPHRAGNHFATVVGGRGNTASGFASTAMNNFTTASGNSSTAMGNSSTASGFASLATGDFTIASGNSSTAMGFHTRALHDGSFVWADMPLGGGGGNFASTAENQFCIRASGGVQLSGDTSMSFGSTLGPKINLYGTTFGIGIQSGVQYYRVAAGGAYAWFSGGTHNDNTYNPGAGGTARMILDPNGNLTITGSYFVTSDRDAKENFAPMQPREVLEKVVALPLSSWNYKADATTRHVGPMAQDFYAAFNVGTDDRHIATVDADGVALAAIQGLNEKVEVRSQRSEVRMQKLEAENAELKQTVNELKKLVKAMNDTPTGGGK